MILKTVKNAEEAVADISNGAMLMMGGFGLSGIPENCIAVLGFAHCLFHLLFCYVFLVSAPKKKI